MSTCYMHATCLRGMTQPPSVYFHLMLTLTGNSTLLAERLCVAAAHNDCAKTVLCCQKTF